MTDKSKITDFNEAKKRVGAQKKDKSQLNGGYEAAVRKQRGHSQKGIKNAGQVRWYHYIQLFLMLGLAVWLMKACNFSQ